MKRIALIGPGRLGVVMASALKRMQYDVIICDRRDWSNERKRRDCLSQVDWAVVCVPDDGADEVMRFLACETALKAIVCTSAGWSLSRLTRPAGRQFMAAKLHPLQSFTHGSQDRFDEGTHFALDGDAELVEVLSGWVQGWRGVIHLLREDQWLRYHLAAVMAANFLPLLIRSGAQILQTLEAGDGDELAWLAPLVRTSVEKGLDSNELSPYSGPAIRGDWGRVNQHADELDRVAPEWSKAYRELSRLMALQRDPSFFDS